MTTNLTAKAPGLNLTNWLWLGRCAPGQTDWNIISATNTCGFYRLATTNDADGDSLSDEYELLVSHSNPTNADTFGNGLPDGWQWHYFGNFNQTATNLDSQGNTLGDDYTNGIDPNIIAFTLLVTNQYVNSLNVPVQINLTGGTPSYYAVLVNDTNLADANWRAFTTTNILVNLGVTDGVYEVEVGLRGLPADATQTWNDYSFTLDRAAPVLVVTNPILAGAAATVIKPYLQLQGFANEPLASLSYGISNAVGVATNLDAFVTGQVFDTNRFDFTTNYFQAYDVPLTNGVNHLTLRMTDRAGNTRTTNFNVTLDYRTATNPPVVKLIWPQDGMAVSGINITIRGTMSDETGTIQAQVVNGDGTTNLIAGLVERNNMFWIENVPLNGTNRISLQATDAAGNVTTTNFTVIPSDLILTIDSMPTGDDLYKPTGSVSGTVSDPTATVTVNGVAVTNDFWTDGETWYWEADNVPIYGRGTATFDAVAYPGGQSSFSSQRMQAMSQARNSSSPVAPPVNTTATKEMDSYVAMVSYHGVESQSYFSTWYGYYFQVNKDMAASPAITPDGQWAMNDQRTNVTCWYEDGYYSQAVYRWSGGAPAVTAEHYSNSEGNTGDVLLNWSAYDDGGVSYTEVTAIPHADQFWGCASCGDNYESAWVQHYYADGVSYHWDFGAGSTFDLSVSAKTRVKLFTGGKAKVARQNLFQLNASGNEIKRPPLDYDIWYPWWDVSQPAIDPAKLIVAGKHPGYDGNIWLVLPDNSDLDITVSAPGKNDFNAGCTAQKYNPYINSDPGGRLDPHTVNVTNCVGQKIVFQLAFDPPLPDGQLVTNQNHWFLPPKYVNAWESFQIYDTNENDGAFFITTCHPESNYLSRVLGQNEALPQEPFCKFYTNLDWLLNQPETGAWWVSKGDKIVSSRPTLTFANGQTVSLTVRGQFNIFRPQMTLFTNYPPFIPMLTNGWVELGLDGYGSPGDTNFDGNINFRVTVESKTSFPDGKVNWTQLNNRHVDYVPIHSTSGYELDNSEFYGGNVTGDPTNQTIRFIDNPGISSSAWPCVNITDQFQTYLRFNPGGDAIWVTLGIVTWGWSEDECYGTTIISTNVVPPTYSDSDNFPQWKAVTHSSTGE